MWLDRIALSMGMCAGTFWRGIPPFEVPDEFLGISPSFEQVWSVPCTIISDFHLFYIYFWTEISVDVLVQGSESVGKWWNFYPHTYFQFEKVLVEYFSG